MKTRFLILTILAWLSTLSGYLGCCDVTIDKAFSDGSAGIGVPVVGSEIGLKPAAGTTTIYALIEARAARTPANAETFTLLADIQQN